MEGTKRDNREQREPKEHTGPENEIRVSFKTDVLRAVERAATAFNTFDNVKFSAINSGISKLILIVEITKIKIANLHQLNRLETLSKERVEEDNKTRTSYLTAFKVELWNTKPKVPSGYIYQAPYTKEHVELVMSVKSEEREEGGFRRGRGGRGRGRGRGRGGFRGGFRGEGEERGEGFRGRGRGGRGRGRGGQRDGEFRPRGDGEREYRPRGDGEFRPRGDGEFRPRGDGEYRPRGSRGGRGGDRGSRGGRGGDRGFGRGGRGGQSDFGNSTTTPQVETRSTIPGLNKGPRTTPNTRGGK